MIDLDAVRAAVAAQARRVTPGIEDMERYLAQQVADESHREIVGPLLAGSGASGVVWHRGEVIAEWGDPDVPEMVYSATKSVVSAVAGVAFDRGLLDVDAPVADAVALDLGAITWHQLLQQTSGWDGELWGKPARADAQSRDARWSYNDVRVNLLCLALTLLLRRSLPDVLREHLMDPLGASASWSWHGYANASVTVDGASLPVVSGGAHWGGGLWMSASDLARLGQLYLRPGALLSAEWIERSWAPCAANPDYGYLWWRNDRRTVFPAAPASGRCARGNGGRHLLWIDPARDLVIAHHWGDGVEALLAAVSAAVPVTETGAGSS